jgi:hypothetical protein
MIVEKLSGTGNASGGREVHCMWFQEEVPGKFVGVFRDVFPEEALEIAGGTHGPAQHPGSLQRPQLPPEDPA